MLEGPDQLRNDLVRTYHAFYTHTKEYVVHLSLHPFALDYGWRDVILEFLRKSYHRDYANSLNKPYREDARKAMDSSALSLSSPPFILTSELVSCLTNDEIIDIVDRIVTLLESDSCLDDDTILRICAFHKHQLSRNHLPELFRNAGRSTEQYFHALECLLSLPIDYFDRAPINYLFTTRWVKEPTLDEWDDVDFERVGIVKRLISQNHLSAASDPHRLNELLFHFVFEIMPHAHHCAARLCQSQLDRLLAPSVDVFSNYFIQLHSFTWQQCENRKEQFVGVCELCDQRVISQCLSRNGFFSRFVTALFDHTFEASEFFFRLIFDHDIYPKLTIEDQNTIQRTFPHFLEEGWQDALEFVYVKKAVVPRDPQYGSSQMLLFFGANFYGLCG
ncbi:hypothetical protein BLNAU_6642 [Blattamonas nauphoetae]|uniref:Uncharacterized protein n=1 Tax=Blattamonas nauphoetae TaxID=2049346 RepID=A0ABQ9Y3P3_9EUKA|nr:hypothetical protein BLNAU_6642 [Blattamonas nauphoetae]